MSILDRWEDFWQMNEDPKGILAGVKNLRFRLRRKSSAGTYREFDFIYTPEDPDNDPFKNTSFIQLGTHFLPAPMTKLNPWKTSEKDSYLNLIGQTFNKPSTKMLRLEGEKVVDGLTEWLTILLLPDSISRFGNGSPYDDLIVVSCRTQVDGPVIAQDGTAHGNPR